MSIQKDSFKRFTKSSDHHHVSHEDVESASESPEDASAQISRDTSTLLRGVPKALEHYYAKPGEAEWGC